MERGPSMAKALGGKRAFHKEEVDKAPGSWIVGNEVRLISDEVSEGTGAL